MINLSIVVPVYNEEESVVLLCEKLHTSVSRIGRSYEIVLVDDGSSDSTWPKMKECAQKYPCFRLVRLRRNFGQTAAMSAGFRESRGGIIITLDADLQNDPADIPKLLAKMDEGFDVVSGWRKNRQDTFVNRVLPSKIANWVISRITGVALHDYGCTLKAYTREIVDNLELYGEMHRFIPALASWVGGKISEVVVDHHARRFGKTKYGISRTFRVILDLITVKFLLAYSTRPIHIFGKVGMWLAVPGITALAGMVLLHAAYRFLGVGYLPLALLIKSPFWVMTSFMLIFFGIQLLCMGLLAEIQIRTYHESQNKPIYVIRETFVSGSDGN
jgi:glycosyltransferase involved in cell wall biosynthesis